MLNHKRSALVSLHLCTSNSWGGLELYASTLMVELKKASGNVIAICFPGSKVEQYLTQRGVQCIHLPNYRKISLSSVRFIQKILTEHDVDVVHVHFHSDIWVPALAMRKDKQRKLLLSIYMGVPEKNDLLHRYIYRRVNAVLTSSEELNARLPSLYPVPKEKIHFVPYGRYIEADVRDESKRREVRSRMNLQDNEFLVGTMVRIDPGKGAMDFARSFLYLDNDVRPKTKYVIVGEPTRKARSKPGESPYEPHCEAYLREIEAYILDCDLQGTITLAGFQEDAIGYLSAMDVFVFPSRDELYSLVMLDAMSVGLPVVAARAGGNLYQIRDGVNGMLYEVGNSKELAGSVSRYLKQPALRRQHGQAARTFVLGKHEMSQTIARLLKLYETC